MDFNSYSHKPKYEYNLKICKKEMCRDWNDGTADRVLVLHEASWDFQFLALHVFPHLLPKTQTQK